MEAPGVEAAQPRTAATGRFACPSAAKASIVPTHDEERMLQDWLISQLPADVAGEVCGIARERIRADREREALGR